MRQPKEEGGQFFSEDNVLKVMLHELVHNEISPHNDDFWKLLDEITQECFHLRHKGIGGTGEGFDAPGQKAGFKAGWGIPSVEVPKDPRKAAANAAEARAQRHAVLAGGGKVGGERTDLEPREAAKRAAERRKAAEEFAKRNGLLDDAVAQEGAMSGSEGGENVGEEEGVVNLVGNPEGGQVIDLVGEGDCEADERGGRKRRRLEAGGDDDVVVIAGESEPTEEEPLKHSEGCRLGFTTTHVECPCCSRYAPIRSASRSLPPPSLLCYYIYFFFPSRSFVLAGG